MSTSSTTGPWAEEPDNDAGRIAQKRREAQKNKEAAWLDIAGALAIENTDNPANLLEACRLGKIRHHFRHKKRWCWTKPVRRDVLQRATIFEKRLVGADGSELENEHWQFQINLSDWEAATQPAGTAGPINEAAIPVPAPVAVEKNSKAGAPAQHDWDEASQYAEQLWREWGDPRDPLSDRDGYRSDIDLARHVADHLRTRDPGRKPPDVKTIADKLRPEIHRLRGRQNAEKPLCRSGF